MHAPEQCRFVGLAVKAAHLVPVLIEQARVEIEREQRASLVASPPGVNALPSGVELIVMLAASFSVSRPLPFRRADFAPGVVGIASGPQRDRSRNRRRRARGAAPYARS